MARTSLGPLKFVLNMGSPSNLGLVMVIGQEAKVETILMSTQHTTSR